MKKYALAIALLLSFPLSVHATWSDFFGKGISAAATETTKSLFKDIILKPIIISPLKKLFGISKKEKASRDTETVLRLALAIDSLKRAGANPKQIAKMSAKLAAKFNNLLDKMDDKKK